MDVRSPYEVLLFDLGGVLVDFAGFEELGHLLPDGFDRAAVRKKWISSPTVQRFECAQITPERFAEDVVEEFGLALSPRQFISAFVDWARGPYPGARMLLENLPESYELACLSNSNELHTPLHRRSMEPLLDRYYFSDELGLVKPEREVFEFVIRDLGVTPTRVAFFDDTAVNVEAARSAGMNAFEVDGVAELEDALRRLGVLSPGPAP